MQHIVKRCNTPLIFGVTIKYYWGSTDVWTQLSFAQQWNTIVAKLKKLNYQMSQRKSIDRSFTSRLSLVLCWSNYTNHGWYNISDNHLLSGDKSQQPHASPHWRETVRLPRARLWQGVCSGNWIKHAFLIRIMKKLRCISNLDTDTSFIY